MARPELKVRGPAAEGREQPAPETRLLWLGVAGAFALLSFVLYSPALHGPFVFDDVLLVETYLRGDLGSQLAQIFSPGALRRVGRITFGLNRHFNGDRTFGYHAVNVAIHAVVGLLLFLVGRRLLERGLAGTMGARRMTLAAFLGALLWLVHPIQVTAVAYIYQRLTSLCALFYLASILAYIEGRLRSGRPRHLLYGLAVLSGLLALQTKENAATLPAFVALIELLFFDAQPLKLDARKVRGALVLAAVLGVIAWSYLGSELVPTINRKDTEAAESTPVRLLTQARVVGRYVTELAYPHPERLNLDEDFTASRSLVEPPTTLLCLVLIAAALALGVYLLPRHRLASFAIFWFFGNLATESTFIPLEHYYEYRLYLPSAIPFVVLVAYVARLVHNATVQRAALAAFALVAVVFGAWTFERSRLFGDELLLWQDNVRKAPNKARPHVNLGNAYSTRGEPEKAKAEYEKAISLNPAGFTASINLAKIHLGRQEFDEARALSEAILRRDPENSDAAFNLAMVHLHQGRMREGMKLLEKIVLKWPDRWAAYNLAVGHLQLGETDRAMTIVQSALRLWPDDSYLTALLGRAYMEQGQVDTATALFRKAVALDPKNALARMALEQLQQTPRPPSR